MKIYISCLIALISLIVGCSPENSPFRMGTSDSGGGNGVDNKVYERYIVRPVDLPVFKAQIMPKIHKYMALTPYPDLAWQLFQKWLLYKTWYIAPVSLNTISKDVIGVSFSPDQTEQLAIQTKTSIWIDGARFARMTADDQAALIIHEMVMSLYYLKFKSWDDVCRENLYIKNSCAGGDSATLNEIFPGSEPKPFDANDYENMRTVTGVLLGDFSFKNTQEIDQLLIQKGFDRRFTFGMGLGGESAIEKFKVTDNEILKVSDLEEILSNAEVLQRLPDECRGLVYKKQIPCALKFAYVGNTGRQLNIKSLDAAKTLDASSVINPFITELHGSGVVWVSQKVKLTYWALNPFPTTKPVRGTAFRSQVLILIQDLSVTDSTPNLLGILSIPGVVTSADPGGALGCRFGKVSARSLADDVLMVYAKNLTETEKTLMRFRAGSFPVFTSCR